MRRVQALAALLVWGCGGEEPTAPSPTPSSGATSAQAVLTATDTWTEPPPVVPGGWRPAPEIPRGGPLSSEDLRGIFPPKWEVGTTWSVLLGRSEISDAPSISRPDIMRWRQYRFRVLMVPRAGAANEYRVSVVARSNPKERYEVFFSGDNLALTKVESKFRDEEHHRPDYVVLTSQGPYAGRLPPRGFPVLPSPVKNPFLLQEPGEKETHLSWQVITPGTDTLVFLIGKLTFHEGPFYWTTDVRMEWRRGEPWWSFLTEPWQYREPPDHTWGAALVDGRLVIGRLLREGEKGELE